jgi:hypothetical protein
VKYTCKTCGFPKDESEFYRGLSKVRKNPRFIRQTHCKRCQNVIAKSYLRSNPHVALLGRCRYEDKRKGYTTNLTKEIMADLISTGSITPKDTLSTT